MSILLLWGVGFALGLFYGVFAGAALAYGLMHHPPQSHDLRHAELRLWLDADEVERDDVTLNFDGTDAVHRCGQCGAALQAVRPGKYQHPNECECE